MFFRKKNDKQLLKYPAITSFWDQSKVAKIAEATYFEISLTSFVATRSFGRLPSYSPLEDLQEAHGVTESPQSLVMFTFVGRPIETQAPPTPPTLGKWMYEVFGTERDGYLGRLHFTFFDQDGAIRMALKQAHAASLTSGRTVTDLVILKEKGVGEFNSKDREHGYPAESRFAFCGLSVTERHQSRHLKKWAVPYFDEDFSKDGAPF